LGLHRFRHPGFPELLILIFKRLLRRRISVRRAWSDEEIAKLRSMAKRYPARVIAAELGRGVSATMVKAHELRLSLKVQSKKIIEPTVDPGPAGFDWPKRLEPVTRNGTVKK